MTDMLRGAQGENFVESHRLVRLPLLDSQRFEYELGNTELPIADHRQEIEAAIRDNSVTILVAPTGSGKTTQVPQYAREMQVGGASLFDEIIVTQPRIVAARTVSERVGDEVGQADSVHSVGYYTSKEGSEAPQRDQHIAFLTDGKAAAQLLHDTRREKGDAKRLLIIDEVHEWNLHIEMLIAIAAERTNPASLQYDKNLKVVIMSATVDGNSLQKHFAHAEPPLISVQVPTHEVVRSVADESVADVALRYASESGGKVLAFLPGKREIADTITKIERSQDWLDRSDRVPALPLHGQLSAEEQSRAFEDYATGAVIATTNAAETSLTVPGALAVVDSGEVRTDRIRYDLVATGSEGLYLEDASQANLNQRAGRVGRTAPGDYVLCAPSNGMLPVLFEERPTYGTPAMQRTSLDGILLHLRASGYDMGDFRFYHQPPAKAVEAARQRLFVLGALDEAGVITDRGLFMEKLPLDPEYSCMIAYAYEKGYSKEVIGHVVDIVAIMQRGGVVSHSPKERAWCDLLAKDGNGESVEKDSDFFVQLAVYYELMHHVDREKWESYDIREHAADLVEQGRESLAKVLGIELGAVVTVQKNNRQAVLNCITAGQLNQLWQRNGEKWSLLLGASVEYDLAESSVVHSIGQLATGKLFSLGSRSVTYTSIQNVNRVVDTAALEHIASHLTTDETSREGARFDPLKQELVVTVKRKLGGLVLRTFTKAIEVDSASEEVVSLQAGHQDHAWNTFEGRRKPHPGYTRETIDTALESPESVVYGNDPITGEPYYAWRGGKGQLVRNYDAAVHSLQSFKAHLDKKPAKEQQRFIKEEVKVVRGQLIALKNGRGARSDVTPAAIKKVLSSMSNTQEWLDEARAFLGVDTGFDNL